MEGIVRSLARMRDPWLLNFTRISEGAIEENHSHRSSYLRHPDVDESTKASLTSPICSLQRCLLPSLTTLEAIFSANFRSR